MVLMESQISKLEAKKLFLYGQCHSSRLTVRNLFFHYRYSVSQLSAPCLLLLMRTSASPRSHRYCVVSSFVRWRAGGRAAVWASRVCSRDGALRVSATLGIFVKVVFTTSTDEVLFQAGQSPLESSTDSRQRMSIFFAWHENVDVEDSILSELLEQEFINGSPFPHFPNNINVSLQKTNSALRGVKIGSAFLTEKFSVQQSEFRASREQVGSLQVLSEIRAGIF